MKKIIFIVLIVLLGIVVFINFNNDKKKTKKNNKAVVTVSQNEIPKKEIDNIVFEIREIKYTSDQGSNIKLELINTLAEEIYVNGVELHAHDKDDKVIDLTVSVDSSIPVDGSVLVEATSKENLLNTVDITYDIFNDKKED